MGQEAFAGLHARENNAFGVEREAITDLPMLYNRHAGMLKKIEGYLADDKSYFVAVGSLHLVGPRGLIEQLKIKGYKVRQL